MKIKISEATPLQLDWMVAKADDKRDVLFCQKQYGKIIVRVAGDHENSDLEWPYSPSTNWIQGGPIIEREKINVKSNLTRMPAYPEYDWMADCPEKGQCISFSGTTPLIAAMRCYVASKLGDEVEIPEELI